MRWCTPTTLLNSGVTEPRFNNFIQYSQIITDKHFKIDIAIRFRMPERWIKVNKPISPILTLKIGCRGNVPWAITKRTRSVIYDQILTIQWKLGENRSSRSWDNLSQMIFNATTTLLNSGVTGPTFTKFTQCSQNVLNQTADIAICFGIPGLWVKVNSPILPILTLKLTDMATSLEPSEKWGQIGNIRWNN